MRQSRSTGHDCFKRVFSRDRPDGHDQLVPFDVIVLGPQRERDGRGLAVFAKQQIAIHRGAEQRLAQFIWLDAVPLDLFDQRRVVEWCERPSSVGHTDNLPDGRVVRVQFIGKPAKAVGQFVRPPQSVQRWQFRVGVRDDNDFIAAKQSLALKVRREYWIVRREQVHDRGVKRQLRRRPCRGRRHRTGRDEQPPTPMDEPIRESSRQTWGCFLHRSVQRSSAGQENDGRGFSAQRVPVVSSHRSRRATATSGTEVDREAWILNDGSSFWCSWQ